MAWEKRWFQYSILLFLAFLWGSSFILMKIGLKSFTSNQAAAIRILSAYLVLLPYSIKHLKNLQKKDLKYLLITGFIGTFIPAFLFTKAQTRIDSAMAGMLNSLTPVFVLLIGLLFYHTRTRWQQIFGLLLSMTGALGLITSGKEVSFANIDSYAFLIVAATLCYGLNMNVVKTHLTHLRGLQITSLSFFFIGPAALIYLLSSDMSSVIEHTDWHFHLGALLFLGIIGTAFAMLIMYSLIRYSTAVFASSVTYIIPAFAILWGIADGEVITLVHMSFMLIILFGVYLINRKA